jgi:hypothetical protein
MAFMIWMVVILIVSIVWSYYSLRKDRQRHEIEKAKKEMSTGRVIFHSSSAHEHEEKLA